MGPIPSELSLDCRPTSMISSEEYVPGTIGAFISQVSMIGNVSERLLKLDSYGKRLEDEMRKIDAFKRELPLCMLLLSDAMTILKMELLKYEKQNMEPILEEFIPLNKYCEVAESEKIEIKKDMDSDDKMNWMSSVQLWSHDHSSESNSKPKEISKFYARKRTLEDQNEAISDNFFKSSGSGNTERASVPFKGGYGVPRNKIDDVLSIDSIGIKRTRERVSCGGMYTKLINHTVSSSSSMPGLQSQVQTPTTRKQRRCWSAQLHRHFVEVLHQLGGCQVATPKQIRELMKVDDLTNDEVKSHLQKFRLHTQKLPATYSTRRDKSIKLSSLQYDSPQSPLQLCGGTSMTLGESMEDEDDEKSESHSSKSHVLDK